MIELYWTKNQNLHKKVEVLLKRKLSLPFKISRTENGKPYIEGNPLYFSISHSRDRAVIAICDRPVGIDFEFYDEKRNFKRIAQRWFTGREQKEIGDCAAYFYINWMAKEAFIKMIGGTISRDITKIEYFNNRIIYENNEYDVAVMANFTAGVYAVCAENYPYTELTGADLKLFRLRKGEKL